MQRYPNTEKDDNFLLLKFGGIKQCVTKDPIPLAIQSLINIIKDTDRLRAKEVIAGAICVLIDNFDGEIWNDFTMRRMSKEQAKTYILLFPKE